MCDARGYGKKNYKDLAEGTGLHIRGERRFQNVHGMWFVHKIVQNCCRYEEGR